MYDEEENRPCMFCGNPVAIDGEGFTGRTIGKKAICEGCLSQLNEALEWAK